MEKYELKLNTCLAIYLFYRGFEDFKAVEEYNEEKRKNFTYWYFPNTKAVKIAMGEYYDSEQRELDKKAKKFWAETRRQVNHND